jgi:outer membrane immunogenic protein
MTVKWTLLVAAVALSSAAQAEVFNGGYVGVQAGFANRSAKVAFTIPGIANFDNSVKGADYGVYIGYNSKLENNLVVGVEAEGGLSGKKLTQALGAGFSASINPRFNYALSARVGYLISENALLYVRGGFASEKLRTEVLLNGVVQPRATSNGFSSGWTAGAGVEYGFSEQLSARLEYRYAKLKGSYNRNQVLVGVGYNF